MECKNLSNRNIVVQSNSLINGKYELTDIQQKLILLAISQVDSKNDTKFNRYSCTVSELEKLLNVKINHKQFRESCEDLFKKPIRILNQKGWELYSWFQSIKYIDAESRFEFRISDDLIPYLLQLKENFTKLELKQAIQFDGKYTTRFYQFAMQVKNQEKKEVKFLLADLYKLLQLPKSLRVYKDFRIYVLEPSIKEINQKTDIKISYEPIKKGRAYAEIILKWQYNKTAQTQKARQTKKFNLKQYEGKEFLYWDNIYQIEYVQINIEKDRIEVIYKDHDELVRADFSALKEIDIAIKKAEIRKEDMRKNPQKYEKTDRSEEFFNKMFHKEKK